MKLPLTGHCLCQGTHNALSWEKIDHDLKVFDKNPT